MFSVRTSAPRAALAIRSFSTTTPRPLAKMQLIGRLADRAEEVHTSTGRDLVRYALGVSHGPRDEQGNRAVSWFKVASFTEGPQKELLLSLPKGSQIYVEADAKMDTYEIEGSKRMSLNLLQRNFELLQTPRNRSDDSVTGAESNQNATEEPLSGVGAS